MRNRNKLLKLPILYALIGFTLSVIAFYPGFMSHDSIFQYSQAQNNQYGDWHPPTMAFLWHLLGDFKSPIPMLILQQALLWSSLFVISLAFKNYKRSNLVFLVGFMPWVSNFSGVIWKDVWMSFLLLFGVSIMIHADRKGSNLKLSNALAVMIFVSLAIAFRHNAIFSAVPFVVYVIAQSLKTKLCLKNRAVIAIVLAISSFTVVGITQIISVFEDKALKTTKTFPENSFMIDDLSNLSLLKDNSLIPGISYEEISNCKDYLSGWDPYSGKISCIQKQNGWVSSNLAYYSLTDIWLENVIKQPLQYFHHRVMYYSFFLRTPIEKPWYFWHPGIDPNDFGFKVDENLLMRMNEMWVKTTASFAPFFFSPFFWQMLNIYLLSVTRRNSVPGLRIIQTLLLSSLLNFMSIFIGGAGADLRYIYWSILSCTVTIIVCVIMSPKSIRPDRNFVRSSSGILALFFMSLTASLGWIVR